MEYPCGFDQSAMKHKPICGVLATALCAGVPYKVAHDRVREATFKANPNRQRFGGRTYLRDLKSAMASLGVKLSETIKVNKPMTVSRFAADVAKPGITYLLQVPGHFVTLRDGVLVDQTANALVNEHKVSRRQVQKFVAILGKGW